MVVRALAVAAYRLGEDALRVLDRVAGPLGGEARAAANELARHDAAAQKRLRAEWAAWARAPVPAGIRSIHPTWLEACVQGLPPRARSAVATSGAGGPVDVWLARWATASFVSMPSVDPTAGPRTAKDAGALDRQAAIAWLQQVGADQCAHALGPTTAALPDAVRDAGARIALPPRAGHLGPVRAAIERCQLFQGDLLCIGANAAAPHLSPVVRRQIVSRMPCETGGKLWHAFETGAGAPLDRCPLWIALTAG